MGQPIVSEFSVDHIERFKHIALEIKHLAGSQGHDFKAWRDPRLIYFSSLSPLRQEFVLEVLNSLKCAAHRIVNNGERLSNTWRLTWTVLKHMGLAPSSDLIEVVEDQDFVAAYNLHHQMIFASLNHFDFVSYSLEELYCRPWMEMFSRDPDVQNVLIERASSFTQGQCNQTISNADLPEHFVLETESPLQRRFLCRSRLYSPIYDRRKPAGFISMNRLDRTVQKLNEFQSEMASALS